MRRLKTGALAIIAMSLGSWPLISHAGSGHFVAGTGQLSSGAIVTVIAGETGGQLLIESGSTTTLVDLACTSFDGRFFTGSGVSSDDTHYYVDVLDRGVANDAAGLSTVAPVDPSDPCAAGVALSATTGDFIVS